MNTVYHACGVTLLHSSHAFIITDDAPSATLVVCPGKHPTAPVTTTKAPEQ